MYKVLSMRSDMKTKFLNEKGSRFGLSLYSSTYKRNALFFLFLLKEIIFLKKPDAVIFRYFNDHVNLIRSVLLAFNVFFTLCLCKVFKVKVFWFLHNINKETHEYYPNIIKAQRCLVGRHSSVIFVTDPLLIPVAKRYYPEWSSKFDFITFGAPNLSFSAQDTTDKEVIDLLKALKSKKRDNSFLLFCPTGAGDKYTHLHKATLLVNEAEKLGLDYKVVILGDLKGYLNQNPELAASLFSNDSITVFDDFRYYKAEDIEPYVDFYWRSLNDESVSFTLYEAASIKKPILTLNEGFMATAIDRYEMGTVLSLDMSNLAEAHASLLTWKSSKASEFFDSHSWSISVGNILKQLQKK